MSIQQNLKYTIKKLSIASSTQSSHNYSLGTAELLLIFPLQAVHQKYTTPTLGRVLEHKFQVYLWFTPGAHQTAAVQKYMYTGQ